MDIWSKNKRSQVMSRILSRDTKPEISVRKMLRGLGYKYRLNVKKLPGKPDIILPQYRRVIFVHGCFWHLHSGCIDGKIPKTRRAYWKAKLLGNKSRDRKHMKELKKMGWKITQFWECDVERKPASVLSTIKKFSLSDE